MVIRTFKQLNYVLDTLVIGGILNLYLLEDKFGCFVDTFVREHVAGETKQFKKYFVCIKAIIKFLNNNYTNLIQPGEHGKIKFKLKTIFVML